MRLAQFVPFSLLGVAVLIGCGGDSTGSITAKSISIVNGNLQSGPGGDDLPDSLRVSVIGSDGGALVGATITWAVTAGGATVSPLTTTTDANGEASAFVSLGPQGPVTITATVHGLAPVTFTANATNPCLYLHAFGVAQTVTGKLRQYDCAFQDGSFVDFYALSLTGQQALSITMTAGFDTYLVLFDLAGNFIGLNDDRSPSDSTSRLKVIAAGGIYVVGANSYAPGDTGPYTLNAVATTVSEDNCEETWSTFGVSTSQVLSTSDCAVAGPFYSDTFLVVMLPGDSLDATVTGATFDSELQLHNGTSTLIASDDSVGGTHLTYNVTAADIYPLVVTSMTAGAHGSYTLTIAALPTTATAIRAPRPLVLPRFSTRSLRAK